MRKVSRRAVLIGGAGALALTLGAGERLGGPARATTAREPLRAAGTTLESVATPQGGGAGYQRLGAGPGYGLVLRQELATRASGADSTEPLAAIVQLTDLHLVDAQSPARFEMFSLQNGSSFRPHEALGSHGAARLVARVNALPGGPFTGRRFDAVVSTGDSTDNGETVELDWFLTVLSGGELVANTGDRRRWEGVQSSGEAQWYNPELAVRDRYKASGFPEIPGYFGRAGAPHTSPGLSTPWYAVFGNHDDSVVGSVPNLHGAWDEVYTGDVKFTRFRADAANSALSELWTSSASSSTALQALHELMRPAALDPAWKVTADERRRPFTRSEFVAAHLDPANAGPGPLGHGFSADDLAAGRTYHSFALAPGVRGIALDSTNPAGLAHGSIDDRQFRWLDAELAAHPDEYAVVFSHHTRGSMDSPLPDPDHPDEPRHGGAELETLLHQHPHVVAWVNGHTHANRITPRADPDPRRSFWEINTASHIDFPQQARVIELARGAGGVLSLFTTLIEADAPYEAAYDEGSQAALASLYRELAFNDPHRSPGHEGRPEDRNTELLLTDPLA